MSGERSLTKQHMSWFINATGQREGVKALINKDQNIPNSLKAAICEVIDGTQTYNGVTVKGHGHSGGGFSSIGELRIESVKIEFDPPPSPEVYAALAGDPSEPKSETGVPA